MSSPRQRKISPSMSALNQQRSRRMTVAGNAPTKAQLQASNDRHPPRHPAVPPLGRLDEVPDSEESTVRSVLPASQRSRRATVAGPAPNLQKLRKTSIQENGTPRTGRQDVVRDFLKEKGLDKNLLNNKDAFRQQYLRAIDKDLERDRRQSLREIEAEKKEREKIAKAQEENAKVWEHASLTMYANLSPEARRAALSEAEEELYYKVLRCKPRSKDLLKAPSMLDHPEFDLEDLTIRLVKARDVINRMLDTEDVDDHDIELAVDAYNAILDV